MVQSASFDAPGHHGAQADPERTLGRIGMPVAVGLLGLIAAVAAFALMVADAVAWPAIVGEELVGLSYIFAGTVAWLRRPRNLIGPAIVGAGVTWFIADFVSVPVAGVTAVAYAFIFVPNLFAAFLLLTYPEGRFFSRAARVVFAIAVAGSVLQYLVRLLLLESSPDYGCDCRNPFAVLPDAGLYDLVMLVTRVVAVLTALAILALVVSRWRHASPTTRRQLTPVLFAGAVGLAAFAADIVAFNIAAVGVAGVTSIILVLTRSAVPIGFLLGLVRTQLDQSRVAQLVVQLGLAPTPERLEQVLASTLHDQTLRVAYWSPAARQYLDRRGRLVHLGTSAGRAITAVERDGSPLAAIEHDAVLSDEPTLLKAVVAALELSIDRGRLESMVRAQASESRSLPRGRVTLLYADIEGSTALLDQLGARYGDLLAEERRLLRAAVTAHGGREIDARADEFFAVFPIASQPAAAALAIQRGLRDHGWPDGVAVRVRIGLHGGEPELGDEGYVGMDVHLVARLGSAGHGGQTLATGSARDDIADDLPEDARLVELGAHELRGVPGRHEIVQIVVPDLPSDFPALRLAGLPSAAAE